MNTFDKIIGYEAIKTELQQVCDMIHNREYYTNLGARLPQGILLYGDPGLGKTLMAKCFIEECWIITYTVRRNTSDKDFIGEITETFRLAKLNAPAVILLDDMDKFANEDDDHCDAEEYVAVQAGIDDVKGCDVFILATVNAPRKLPRSLTRSGRFDRKICVNRPNADDARQIIAYYLSDKSISSDVNMDDLCKMISYDSCAELETILNEAAVDAAFARKEQIDMKDLVNAVLRMEYDAPDDCVRKSDDDVRRIALHEAGHVILSEVLCPGSIGLTSLRTTGRDSVGGFVHRCKELERRPHVIMVSLAGKAAVELFFADHCASGCQSDLERAYNLIRDGISKNATCGIGMLDVESKNSPEMSDLMNYASEAVVHTELERYLYMTRDVLLKNRDFLERVTAALVEKETLLASDIQSIRDGITITEFVA